MYNPYKSRKKGFAIIRQTYKMLNDHWLVYLQNKNQDLFYKKRVRRSCKSIQELVEVVKHKHDF